MPLSLLLVLPRSLEYIVGHKLPVLALTSGLEMQLDSDSQLRVWPLVVCTLARNAIDQAKWRYRFKRGSSKQLEKQLCNRQTNPAASWPGVLTTNSQNIVKQQLSEALHVDDVSSLLRDDGRRVSLCLALVQLSPNMTLMHPIEVLSDMLWADLEGPHEQRAHFQVVAFERLPEIVCVPSSVTVGSQQRTPAFFRLSRMTLESLGEHVAPVLCNWKHAGLMREEDLVFGLGVPRPLGLLLLHQSVSFLAMSNSRLLPPGLPDIEHILRLRRLLQSQHASKPQDRATSSSSSAKPASAALTASSFQLLVETLDSWTDVMLRGTARDPERREEIFQEMNMLRRWGCNLAHELHPLTVAATKLEGSKLQQGVLGKGLRLKARLWGASGREERRRLKKIAGSKVPEFFLSGRYASWFAIHSVMFASFLKNSDRLSGALKQALSMAFAPNIASDLLEALGSVALPSAATLSRWRLQFEAASSLLMREDVSQALLSEGLTLHVLIDSSPQGGRDWLLTEVHMLGHKLPLPDTLKNLWRTCAVKAEVDALQLLDGDVESHLDELDDLEDALQSAIQVLVLTPSGLGHQRSNVHHKFHAFIHSLWVCVGKSLPRVIRALASFTTDFGTEAGLVNMCAPGHLLCRELLVQAIADDEHDGNEDDLCDIDLRHAFQIPGGHHILHNLCQDVCEALPHFHQYKPHLQAMAVFLCDKHVREGLQEKCFSTGLARVHRALFDSFSARLIDWRWQSLSEFVAAVEPLEQPLRECWDVSKFVPAKSAASLTGGVQEGHLESEPLLGLDMAEQAMDVGADKASGIGGAIEDAQQQQAAFQKDDAIRSGQQATASRGLVRAARFHLAVSDPKVWNYIRMLRTLLKVPDELLGWLQSCPCHPKQSKHDDPAPESKHTSCVMTGRRAPELAAGFLADFVKDKLEGAVRMFPAQSELYADYAAGLQHINFLLQFKFSFWSRLPYSLLAIAHPNESVARNSARRILGQWETFTPEQRAAAHGVAREFLEDTGVRSFRRILVGFIQGRFSRGSDEFRPVCARLACWAFAPLLERSIEGRHAIVKRAAERAPNHSGAYISSALRMPGLIQAIELDPKVLLRLEKHFSSIRLPVFALRHLGLMHTPAVACLVGLDLKTRNKRLQDTGFVDRVVFRLDAATQFESWERILPSPHGSSDKKVKALQDAGLSLTDSGSNALQRHLALEHFRMLHKSNDFFAAVLPEDTSVLSAVDFPFRALTEVLGSSAVSEGSTDAIFADDGEVLVIEREEGGPLMSWGSRARTDIALLNAQDHRFARVAVFKVEKWQPSLLKQVKGTGACVTSLTAADIAVTLFPVVHVKAAASSGIEDHVLYTTAVPQGAEGTFAGAVALVNEALFMSNVFKFRTLPEKLFLWEGPLTCASQKDMDDLVQMLMLAGAVPGSGKSLVSSLVAKRKTAKSADTHRELLQRLADSGWVQSQGQGVGSVGWSLTEAGYAFVRPCIGLTQPVSVLRPRLLDDRSAWTRFEIMLHLREKGWLALPLPKRVKDLKLPLVLPETGGAEIGSRPGQTWYYGPKTPQVSKVYLQAMLAIEEHRQVLLDAGLEAVCHVASAAYFKCLLRIVSGEASLAELCDLGPGKTKAAGAVLAIETEAPHALGLSDLLNTKKADQHAELLHAQDDGDDLDAEPVSPAFLPPSPKNLGASDHGVAPLPDPALRDPALPDPALPDPALPDPALPDPGLPDPGLPDPGLAPLEDDDIEERPAAPKSETIERKRREKTHMWGCFLITYKVQQPAKRASSSSKDMPKAKYSWQAICNMPQHNQKTTSGKVAKCTKTMAFDPSEPNAEQVCLWRIRHWCNCCCMFQNKTEHQAFHPGVDDLPEESAITSCKIDSFLDPPSLASAPAGPSKKRKRVASKASSSSSTSSSSSSTESSSDS